MTTDAAPAPPISDAPAVALQDTDSIEAFLSVLRAAIDAGDALVAPKAPPHLSAFDDPDSHKLIGFYHKGGVALLPQRAISAVIRRIRVRIEQEPRISQPAVLHELWRAGHLIRSNAGRQDLLVRVGEKHLTVWYVYPDTLGLPDVDGQASQPALTAPEPRTAANLYYRDSLGALIPRSRSKIDEQMVDTLRFVGRIRYATTDFVHNFVYHDQDRRTVQRALRYLVDNQLLWKVPGRQVEFELGRPVLLGNNVPPGRRPHIYGLSPQGKEWLKYSPSVEVDERHEKVLKASPISMAADLASKNMSHDLQVAWWLSSVVTHLRYNRWCQGVYLETEFIAHEKQRIDAFLSIRLNLHTPRTDPRKFWIDSDMPDEGDVVVRLALEMDNDTEAPRIIHLKGNAYAQLTHNGVYQWLFDGPVVPVFIVPTLARKEVVMREFASIWPGNWGICATTADADDKAAGVLWGLYHRMNKIVEDEMPEVLRPLTLLEMNTDRTIRIRPAISAEHWRRGAMSPPPWVETKRKR